MPTDGLTLAASVCEMKSLIGAKVDKVTQPETDEIHIALRKDSRNVRLLLCASAEACRVHITEQKKANPAEAPMFCMLLRKHLTGGRLIGVTQPNSDRIVRLEIESTDELYDIKHYIVIVEVMGRHSNIILTDSDGVIIDCLKRVGLCVSSARTLLPGVAYSCPPTAKKIDPKSCSKQEFIASINSFENGRIDKCLSGTFYGLAPNIAYYLTQSMGIVEENVQELGLKNREKLACGLYEFYQKQEYVPTVIYETINEARIAKLICAFVPVLPKECLEVYSSAGQALDTFYAIRDAHEYMRRRSGSLVHTVRLHIERRERKLALYDEAIAQEANFERFRLFGELITANMYQIKQGMRDITVENYYSEEHENISIELDEQLNPSQNAQRYFKKYRKAKSGRDMALSMRENVQSELEYLYGQADNIEKSTYLCELSEIREELEDLSYIKKERSKKRPKKQPEASKPHKFISNDGFVILVGKNNRQNDVLTQKTAQGDDVWLHVKDRPGSHTLIVTNGAAVPNDTLLQAARLASYYSSARASENVAVDYMQKRYVKKPGGALPGKVTYTNQRTLFVMPGLCLPPVK